MGAWQHEHPGLTAVESAEGFDVDVPAGPGTAHEEQFPLVLDEFLRAIASGHWPDERAADTLAKYELLAHALTSRSG